MSEVEFENSLENLNQTSVADKALESHLTYRQNPSLKGSHPPDAKRAIIAVKPDQINNLTQKETAMASAGVTRAKTYAVIARLLEAKRWTDVVDDQGNVRRELVDDLDKQALGVEKALRAFGDMIERREIEVDVGDKTLEAYRAMSVAELKRKAEDLLLGKRVVDVEIIK